MKRTPVFIVFFCMLVLILSAINGFSQDIKERMKDRLPLIVELKKKGVVGENNMGLLQFVGETKEQENVVKEENNDRMKVYEAIAKQQGGTAEIVGKRRAIQIAEKAETGEWLQDEQGAWYQKK
jgi:uncharacterized protein YdbL (DUF1318 family)